MRRVFVVGLSQKSAPLALREALAFPAEGLAAARTELRERAGLPEVAILSTCNRVELWGACDGEPPLSAVAAFLADHGRVTEAELVPHLYRLSGEAAIRHSFRVASGLDSMVVGETQILGQLKDAFGLAEEAGDLGPALATLRARSVQAARRARTESGIGKDAVSVSSVAVELARKIFGDLGGRRVLVVGAGKMSRLAAQELAREGARLTVVGGRTLERAAELASELDAVAVPLEALPVELCQADIVISGTGCPHFVVARDQVETAIAGRGGRPLFLIDIALPRDVDPAVRGLSGVFLYDLDDLQSVATANLEQRQRRSGAAEALVEEEVGAFVAWQEGRDRAPLILELRRRAEEIRKTEVDKARRKLQLSAEQETAFDALAQSIVNKLLHAPTVALKQAGDPRDLELARVVLGL